jgi:hypothetical protein
MHKLLWATAALLLLSGKLFSQDAQFDRFSVGAQFGVNNPVDPMALGYDTRSIGLLHAGLDGRFMLSPQFGLRLHTGYDRFSNNEDSPDFKTNYFRISAEGVVNAGTMLHFYDWTDRIGLLVHGGFGYSYMNGENIAGKDQMLHAVIGVTPQVRLSDRWAVSLDLTTVAHVYQSRTYDFTENQNKRGVDGRLFNLSLGVQYYFGTGRHADWVVPSGNSGKVSELEARLQQMQEREALQESRYDSIVRAMSDPDQDGVPAYLDQEPGSAIGAVVNTKGITVPKESVPEATPSLPAEGEDFTEFPDKQELFYSVQVGYFRLPVDLEKIYGLSPLLKTFTRTGETRYLYGTYRQLADAQQMKDVSLKRGVVDAFVVAYYKGKRIPIGQAEALLATHGNTILEPVH